MTTQIDIMADADLIAALNALNARLTMLDDKMRALHDENNDAIRQLQERLDVAGSILDSVRADLYIKETEQAYSDALNKAGEKVTIGKYRGKWPVERCERPQEQRIDVSNATIDNLEFHADHFSIHKPASDHASRNEAALDLIKTAYNEWLNDARDPFHPNVVRKLVSSIADALAGRPPRDR